MKKPKKPRTIECWVTITDQGHAWSCISFVSAENAWEQARARLGMSKEHLLKEGWSVRKAELVIK